MQLKYDCGLSATGTRYKVWSGLDSGEAEMEVG